MNNQISILGCGWLGLPLAASLLTDGYVINGSTTSEGKLELLKNTGINPFLITISQNDISGPMSKFLENSSVLIINIPPGLRKNPELDVVHQMKMLAKCIENSEIKHVLYISSTSVFEEEISIPTITEATAPNGKSKVSRQLIGAEKVFTTNPHSETTILRFGGLIGEDRHPAKYLAGKQQIKDPDGPVNLIHLKDCIGIIKTIINGAFWNTTFNAATPQHPTRIDFYTAQCMAQNLPLPHFDTASPSKGKIISSNKVGAVLNYEFQHRL